MLKYITPRIRFQGFKSWWKSIKLTDLGIFVGGTAIESEFNPEGKYKVISIGSYSEESKYKDQGIRAIYSKKTEKRILEKDDLTMILNDKTSTGKIIGRVLLIDEDNSYVYNQRTQRICLNKNKYVPDFIFQLLNADINRNKIVRSAQGNTQIYVNWSDISNLDYLIPESLEEQQAIGSLFRTLDDLMASYKDNLANYQSLKATMLSKMFPKTGQTVPEIRLDRFEGEWEINKLNKYLTVSMKKNTQQKFGKEDVLSVSGEVGIVNQIQFQGRSFAGVSVEMYSIVDTGNIVYTKSPLKANPYGIIKTNYGIPGIVSTLYAVYLPNENVFPGFVERYFENDLRLNSYLKPLVNKGAKNDMKVSDENALLGNVIFPKSEEQVAISDYFTNLDKFIQSYKEKISQLETLKKKLLQDMFI